MWQPARSVDRRTRPPLPAGCAAAAAGGLHGVKHEVEETGPHAVGVGDRRIVVGLARLALPNDVPVPRRGGDEPIDLRHNS